MENRIPPGRRCHERVITFGFVGLEVFTGVLLALLLVFLNVENGIEKKQTEIKAREEK